MDGLAILKKSFDLFLCSIPLNVLSENLLQSQWTGNYEESCLTAPYKPLQFQLV